MIADHLTGINKFESELWKIADDLRANSGLASNEYFMPIMGLIFLRHATNRFYEAKAAIEADKAAGRRIGHWWRLTFVVDGRSCCPKPRATTCF
jgi:type I restriction enzyme M protein